MQQVDVQCMALDPLAAVEEASQAADLRVDARRRRGPRRRGPPTSDRRPGRCRRCAPRCRSPRPACGRRRGARSSAAPRRSRGAPPRTCPSRTRERQPALALDTGQLADVELRPHRSGASAPSSTDVRPATARPRGSRNGGLQALKPAKRRSTWIELALLPEPAMQAGDVGLLARPEAGIAGAPVGGADRTAAGLGQRAQAWLPAGDEHAHVAAPLALQAHRLARQLRPAADAQRGQQLEELPGIDRAAAQLGIDLHVLGDRCAGRQRARRNPASGRRRRARLVHRPSCAGPGCRPRWRRRRWSPAVCVRDRSCTISSACSRRADRALDEQNVVGPVGAARGRLGELDELEALGRSAGAGPRGRAASAGSRHRRRA